MGAARERLHAPVRGVPAVGELSMDMSPAYIKGAGEHYCGDMMTAEGRSADARGIGT